MDSLIGMLKEEIWTEYLHTIWLLTPNHLGLSLLEGCFQIYKGGDLRPRWAPLLCHLNSLPAVFEAGEPTDSYPTQLGLLKRVPITWDSAFLEVFPDLKLQGM